MLPSEYLAQGWCQHALQNDQGEYCLLGAAKQWGGSFTKEYSQFTLGIYNQLRAIGAIDEITGWNNAPERTQAEVVALARLVEIKLGLRPRETEAQHGIETLEGITA